jgi:hypothetical protein
MIKSVISKAKRFAPAVIGSGALVALTATNAFAVGVADAGVTTAFSGMADNLGATLSAVAPFAVAIMVIIFGFKYGKKIFKMIAS